MLFTINCEMQFVIQRLYYRGRESDSNENA